MNRTNTIILAALVTGLVLTACGKGTDQETTGTGLTKAELLSRDLDPAQVANGRAIYDRYCQECHGTAGKGKSGDWRVRDADGHFPPPPLDDSAHAWHHTTAALLEMIREGSPTGQGKMPAWKSKLTEQEMQDVVSYIKSLWSEPIFRQWLNMEQQSLGG